MVAVEDWRCKIGGGGGFRVCRGLSLGVKNINSYSFESELRCHHEAAKRLQT